MPPRTGFQLISPTPLEREVGAAVHYRVLLLKTIPAKLDTEVTVWEPHRMVEELVQGPFGAWSHEMRFTPKRGADGSETVVLDYRLEFGARFGGPWVERKLIARHIRQVFAFREAKLVERFGSASG